MTWTITLLINENTGTSSAGNRTCALFTPPANSLLVTFAVGGRDNQTVARNWQIIDSLSGAWTNIAESALTNWGPNVTYNARYALNVRAWRQAVGGTPAARTVTVDASANSEFYGLIIFAITGHDAASPLAQAAVANAVQAAVEGDSALSLTLTLGSAPTSGNLVLAMFGAGADGGGGFAVPTGYTPLANQNLNYCPGAVFYHASTATAAVTCSDLGQTVGNAGGIILEIAAASGGTITQAIGQVSETDTALPVIASKAKSVGQAAEADAALPVTAVKARAAGQVGETDTALAVARIKTKTIGVALETAVSQPMVAQKTKATGIASETDAALPVTAVKARTAGLASEADSALAFVIGSETVVATGLVSETDAALPVARVKRLAIGQAVESVTALPMTARKTAVVGQVQEADEALALVNRKTLAIGLVSETAVALAVGTQKRLIIGQASEINAVFTLTGRKTAVIGLVSEMDVALAFVLLGLGDVVREVVLAGQFDPVVVLVGQFDPDVALAGEFDPVVSLRGEL